jgi:hypothetical protein
MEYFQQKVLQPTAEAALKAIQKASYGTADRYRERTQSVPETTIELDENGNEVSPVQQRMNETQQQLDSVRRARKYQEDPSTKGWTREQWLRWTEETR